MKVDHNLIVYLHIKGGMTHAEIARCVGLTRERIRQVCNLMNANLGKLHRAKPKSKPEKPKKRGKVALIEFPEDALKLTISEDGCELWPHSVFPKTGYARNSYLRTRGHSQLVHRAVWEAVNGTLKNSEVLKNRCGKHNCILPDHWEAMSRSDYFKALGKGNKGKKYKRKKRTKKSQKGKKVFT